MEGQGAISMAELVRRSLRMNPSRVIVGEVLGDEIVTMLNAMSQGNDGSLSTIHANSSLEVFNRIATYAIQSAERLPVEATHMLIAGAIDFVVFIEKRNEYSRRRPAAPVREQHPRGDRGRRAGAVQRGVLPRPGRPGGAARTPVLPRPNWPCTATTHRGGLVTGLLSAGPLLAVLAGALPRAAWSCSCWRSAACRRAARPPGRQARLSRQLRQLAGPRGALALLAGALVLLPPGGWPVRSAWPCSC